MFNEIIKEEVQRMTKEESFVVNGERFFSFEEYKEIMGRRNDPTRIQTKTKRSKANSVFE